MKKNERVGRSFAPDLHQTEAETEKPKRSVIRLEVKWAWSTLNSVDWVRYCGPTRANEVLTLRNPVNQPVV
jgi:hypothetical protein